MQSLNRDIERSARKIFKLFFGSRLYLNKSCKSCSARLWGVDLLMNFNGKKRFSIRLEENTLKAIMKRLTGDDNLYRRTIAYGIIGEMASIIAMNAFSDFCDNIVLDPVRLENRSMDIDALMFSSSLGRFAIAIEDI